MAPDCPTLEVVTRNYASSLNDLLTTLRTVQAQFQAVTGRSSELEEVLKMVGAELSRQPPSEGTEHALSMLAWVLRTGEDTKLLVNGALGTYAHVLPRLSILQNVASDLASAVSAASTPSTEAEESVAEQQLQTG